MYTRLHTQLHTDHGYLFTQSFLTHHPASGLYTLHSTLHTRLRVHTYLNSNPQIHTPAAEDHFVGVPIIQFAYNAFKISAQKWAKNYIIIASEL